jgi:hypothetical protein
MPPLPTSMMSCVVVALSPAELSAAEISTASHRAHIVGLVAAKRSVETLLRLRPPLGDNVALQYLGLWRSW